MSRNFKLTVAYDGTDYAGWQTQPGQATIQTELQKAIRKITGESVKVIGSGRTDSGVHAIAQVANCKIQSWPADAASLLRAVNTFLPETIVVTQSVEVHDDFHAIRDATRKRYRYQLQLGGARDVYLHRYHWRLKHKIDPDLVRQAATYIVGEQDFASFQAAGAIRKSTVRHVYACDVFVEQLSPEANQAATPRQRLTIEVEANGFLYNMVRNIVGTMVEVGRGRQPPEWIPDVLAAKNRDLAGQTAPPQGLFLKFVEYPDNSASPPADSLSN
ncbi:tRNA pseudouridine(38-40) synthase TruA [Planctomycetes bacterium K23_9]|uniref:tRNA pseudouridine synthase A n=1 Tax=Stieleria marina TaxID=1930275 RepID=A0A517NP45_9BACT|nr:tRNA pseudouridine synthase A [Planctomycetes bacterium K23_9]